MLIVTIALSFCAVQAAAEDPQSYLVRADRALQYAREDMTATAPVVEAAADKIAAGGKLWATGQPSLVSEFCGRAGGFMMIRDGKGKTFGANDVVLHFGDKEIPAPDAGEGMLIVFGDDVAASGHAVRSHAAEAGISPTLANAVVGWVFAGELISAVARRGKMPVIYESIGAYGGNARIRQYENGEIAFHPDMAAPSVPAGVIGARYVEIISGMLQRIQREESAKLAEAGAWARQARENKKTLYMYSMGHLFPGEVENTEIGKMFKSAVWNAGFRSSPPPVHAYEKGDVAIHIGYQHPPRMLLDDATGSGAKVVYVSVMPDRNYTRHQDAIYIDPMWDWPDACVPMDGYDVPLCAASGVVNGAIAWEIYRLAKGE